MTLESEHREELMGRIWEHDVKTCDTVLEFGKYGVQRRELAISPETSAV